MTSYKDADGAAPRVDATGRTFLRRGRVAAPPRLGTRVGSDRRGPSERDAGTEWVAVRPDAKMDGSKPISGGLSHCFPQFGPGAIQQRGFGARLLPVGPISFKGRHQHSDAARMSRNGVRTAERRVALRRHGFGRNVDWDIVATKGSSATFRLSPSAYSKAMWDEPFVADFTVSLTAASLDTTMNVQNTGSGGPFDFQAALHSYFDVSSLENVSIEGSFEGATSAPGADTSL